MANIRIAQVVHRLLGACMMQQVCSYCTTPIMDAMDGGLMMGHMLVPNRIRPWVPALVLL